MKKDIHKGLASDLVKGLINSNSSPQLQEQIQVKNPAIYISPLRTDKFTVEIESTLMDRARLFGVQNKIKLRKMFEIALSEYLDKRTIIK